MRGGVVGEGRGRVVGGVAGEGGGRVVCGVAGEGWRTIVGRCFKSQVEDNCGELLLGELAPV